MTEFETSELIVNACGGMNALVTKCGAKRITRHPDGLSFEQEHGKLTKVRTITFERRAMGVFTVKTTASNGSENHTYENLLTAEKMQAAFETLK
jgi:hypothetical protein